MAVTPNPRLQRTRSASPPSPLSRQPLGRARSSVHEGFLLRPAFLWALVYSSCFALIASPGMELTGRVVDAQRQALPGAVVTAASRTSVVTTTTDRSEE